MNSCERSSDRSLELCAILAVFSGCSATSTSIGAWFSEGGAPSDATSSAEVDVGPDASSGFYLEAEEGELAGGFLIGNDGTASASRFLEPPSGVTSTSEPGAARARYAFDVPVGGRYTIWGRIRSPDASHNTFWFQVDGAPWFVWRLTTGEIWYWAELHENSNYGMPLSFDLTAGAHEMIVANSVAATAIDRFYFTPDSDTPPGNDTPCNPPHSIQVGGACIPSCGSQGGNGCGAQTCQGRTILPAYDCDVCCRVP